MESYQEKADAISKRFGISAVEAMKALEECDGNPIDAVSLLEAKGIINNASATFSTGSGNIYVDKNTVHKEAKNILKRYVDAYKGDKLVFRLPLLFVLILLLASFWSVVITLIVGIFMDFRFTVSMDDNIN